MSITNYNSGDFNKWAVDNKDFPYIKLNELVPGRDYPFLGCFVSPDNGYGEGAVLITADFNVNCPGRYVDQFKKMQHDKEVEAEANSGRAFFRYTVFKSEKYNRDGYRLEFSLKK